MECCMAVLSTPGLAPVLTATAAVARLQQLLALLALLLQQPCSMGAAAAWLLACVA
jgi:hypothetical protein